jgi:hypothetical protein
LFYDPDFGQLLIQGDGECNDDISSELWIGFVVAIPLVFILGLIGLVGTLYVIVTFFFVHLQLLN